MLFSQRNNYKPASKTIQRESLDQETRNLLWNILSSFFHTVRNERSDLYDSILRSIWGDFFKQNIDFVPKISKACPPSSKYYLYCQQQFCCEMQWYECFDFLEFIIPYSLECDQFDNLTQTLINDINQVLEQESTAYRFVRDKITEITSKTEIETIDSSLSSSDGPETIHLQKALSLLSDRKSPDYNNSVKESISAVEAMCCKITSNNKATLNQALDYVEQKYPLHGALKKAFSALYGYASDAQGIRHGGIDFTNVDYPLAKYMLVSCCAFINYLRTLKNEE